MPETETLESVETDVSIELPCEHPNHGQGGPFHKDGDPHYIQFFAPCGHYGTQVKVACGQWVKTIRGCWCKECDVTYPAEMVLKVLGPVGSI